MILDENLAEEEKQIVLTDREIFIKIWTEPRMVIQYIHQNSYDKFVIIILVLVGISNAFQRIVTSSFFERQPAIVAIGLGLVLGGLFGWLGNYIYAALLTWAGKIIGGKAEIAEVFRMTAYAAIPSLFSIFFVFFQLVYFGKDAFRDSFDPTYLDAVSVGLYFGSAIILFILGIWTLVILVIGLSVVNNFSIARSIVCLILSMLFIIIPSFFLAMIFIG